MSRSAIVLASVGAFSLRASAGTVLDCLTPNNDGLGYDQDAWTGMTALLNTANGAALATTSDLTNLTQMLSYNGLWVDVRQPQTGTLTSAEIVNLQAYIATGRRVVLIGGPGPTSDDSGYSSWDNSILSAVGAPTGVTFLDNAATPAYATSPLTDGVSTISVTSAAAVSSGTTLFNQKVATIWGPARNALVFLDSTTISDFFIGNDSDTTFAQNLATWITDGLTDGACVWESSSGGSWQGGSVWQLSEQPSIADDAKFNLNSAGGYTVTVPAALTARNLIVQNDKVTFDLSNASANLTMAQGISIGAATSASGLMTITHSSGGSTAAINASSLSIGGNGGSGSLTVTNGVQLTISGATTIASGSSINVSGGSVTTGTLSNAGTLTIGTSGQLSISTATGPGMLNTISTLSISGKLDLTNTDLDVSNGNLSTITSLIRSGYGNGSWNGDGIISSTAADDTTHLTTLGVILNGDTYGTATGSLGNFDGINPAATDVLVKYTYFGDANLDGQVDGSDYTKIDNGFHNRLTGWANGDFNYDGMVDGSDYTLIDNAYNTQGSRLVAASTAQIAGAQVPEPAMFGMSCITLALLGRRRR